MAFQETATCSQKQTKNPTRDVSNEPIFVPTLWGLPEPQGPAGSAQGPAGGPAASLKEPPAGKASSCWSKLSPHRHSVRSLPTPLYTPTAQREAADAQTCIRGPRAPRTSLPATLEHSRLPIPQLERTACRRNPIYVKITCECTGLTFLCMAGFPIIFTLSVMFFLMF